MKKINTFLKVNSLSGLVLVAENLIGISDEYYNLYISDFNDSTVFDFDSLKNQELAQLVYAERKKIKPDFESISLFKLQNKRYLHLLPSFSKPLRKQVYVIEVLSDSNNHQNLSFGNIVDTSMNSLLVRLIAILPEVNIEGHFFLDQDLLLLNRGNLNAPSSLVRIKNYHNKWLTYFQNQKEIEIFENEISITEVDLGCYEGFNIHWTEAELLNANEFIFLASVEQTDNAYDDGSVLGSFVGKFNLVENKMASLKMILKHEKAEGLALRKDKFIVCTDPDSEHSVSQCYIEDLTLLA